MAATRIKLEKHEESTKQQKELIENLERDKESSKLEIMSLQYEISQLKKATAKQAANFTNSLIAPMMSRFKKRDSPWSPATKPILAAFAANIDAYISEVVANPKLDEKITKRKCHALLSAMNTIVTETTKGAVVTGDAAENEDKDKEETDGAGVDDDAEQEGNEETGETEESEDANDNLEISGEKGSIVFGGSEQADGEVD